MKTFSYICVRFLVNNLFFTHLKHFFYYEQDRIS